MSGMMFGSPRLELHDIAEEGSGGASTVEVPGEDLEVHDNGFIEAVEYMSDDDDGLDYMSSGGTMNGTPSFGTLARSLQRVLSQWVTRAERRQDLSPGDCDCCLRLLGLFVEWASKLEVEILKNDAEKRLARGAIQVFREARNQVRRAVECCPMQLRFFAQTYKCRIATSLHKVDTAARALEPVADSVMWPPKDDDWATLRTRVHALFQFDEHNDDGFSKLSTEEEKRQKDKIVAAEQDAMDELLQEALTVTSSDGTGAHFFWKKLQFTASALGVAENADDCVRQLTLIRNDPYLSDDLASARACAEDELSSVSGGTTNERLSDDYSTTDDDADDTLLTDEDKDVVLAERRQEREETREYLILEQCLYSAVHVVASVAPSAVSELTCSDDYNCARSSMNDDDDEEHDDSTVNTWHRSEALKLDAETARIVAQTAAIENQQRRDKLEYLKQQEQFKHAAAALEAARNKTNENTPPPPPETNTGGTPPSSTKSGRARLPPPSQPCDSPVTTPYYSRSSSVRFSDEERPDFIGISSPQQQKIDPEIEAIGATVCGEGSSAFDNAARARAAARLSDLLNCSSSSSSVDESRRNFVSPRLISGLVTIMNTHVKQPELDEFAKALAAVVHDHPRNKRLVMEQGCVAVLISLVANTRCDHRYLVPLWRTLAAESSVYAATLRSLACAAESSSAALAEKLCHIAATSADAEELLLAARALLLLLKHHPSFRRIACDKGGLRAFASVLDRQLSGSDDGDEILTASKAKHATARVLMLLLFQKTHSFDVSTPEGASAVIDAIRGHVINAGAKLVRSKSSDDISSPKTKGKSANILADTDLAIMALTRTLMDVMVVAARRPPQQQNGASNMAFVIRELIDHVGFQAPMDYSTERAIQIVWVIKEQAAKAIRKLIKLSVDADIAAAVKSNVPVIERHPRAERLVQFAVRCDAIPAFLTVLADNNLGGTSKRALFAKEEAAHVIQLIATHDTTTIDAMMSVNYKCLSSLLRLIDAVDKDANKEAGVTALYAICKSNQKHRTSLVQLSNGIPSLLRLVARTGTNAGDEAAANLLADIVRDDPEPRILAMKQHPDLFDDLKRSVQWNLVYGDTPKVRAANRSLRNAIGTENFKATPDSLPGMALPPSANDNKKAKRFAEQFTPRRAASARTIRRATSGFLSRSSKSLFRRKKSSSSFADSIDA